MNTKARSNLTIIHLSLQMSNGLVGYTCEENMVNRYSDCNLFINDQLAFSSRFRPEMFCGHMFGVDPIKNPQLNMLHLELKCRPHYQTHYELTSEHTLSLSYRRHSTAPIPITMIFVNTFNLSLLTCASHATADDHFQGTVFQNPQSNVFEVKSDDMSILQQNANCNTIDDCHPQKERLRQTTVGNASKSKDWIANICLANETNKITVLTKKLVQKNIICHHSLAMFQGQFYLFRPVPKPGLFSQKLENNHNQDYCKNCLIWSALNIISLVDVL
ncbi:hypothetical protein RFI_14601 [Reticulomyxa filosa]|uniref:Uncharacterized protein n=1 Tax=Reticulomyxa filosa TaxID=46433 RepID=X6N9J3_RETFI|nr:hypothetical protein RFI_14601 [Reticulomyxa filosa]|eukprot:ETO22593.1 hypothetical protein RFI_14601 [Reticulomyxa filosa]